LRWTAREPFPDGRSAWPSSGAWLAPRDGEVVR